MQQPWGVLYQKVIAMSFFFGLWIVSLYFLFREKFNLTEEEQEKGKWLFHAIGSAIFVFGGIFLVLIKPESWVIGSLAIVFFSFCLTHAIKKYREFI